MLGEFVARITRSWDETPALRGVELAAASHPTSTAPGQYLKVSVDPVSESFFALASAPGEPPSLLVKRGAPVANALAALAEGSELRVSEPLGKGYPAAQHHGRDLVLVAAGAGIAPLRGVVRHVLSARERFGAVRLYYGQHSAADFAYHGEHDGWRARGVEVDLVASATRGRVQDALRAAPPPLANAVAYLCGMKGMVQEVTALLGELGLPRERVFLNY